MPRRWGNQRILATWREMDGLHGQNGRRRRLLLAFWSSIWQDRILNLSQILHISSNDHPRDAILNERNSESYESFKALSCLELLKALA